MRQNFSPGASTEARRLVPIKPNKSGLSDLHVRVSNRVPEKAVRKYPHVASRIWCSGTSVFFGVRRQGIGHPSWQQFGFDRRGFGSFGPTMAAGGELGICPSDKAILHRFQNHCVTGLSNKEFTIGFVPTPLAEQIDESGSGRRRRRCA